MRLTAFIGAAYALYGIVFAGALAALEATLRIAVATPTEHPHSVSAREFAWLLEELSGGEVAVTVSDNDAIGSNPVLLAAIQAGIINFTISTPGVMTEYAPVTGILELPYVFSSMDHMMAVTRGEIGAGIAETYEAETGIAILGYMGGAQRNMITTEATINSTEDPAGLRMRTREWDVMLNWWDSLGSVVSFPEAYTALQTGVVDGAENEFSTFTTARWVEVAQNVSLTQHSITVRPLVGNAASPAELSDEQFAADEGLEDLAAAIAAAAN